jgi:glycosyltransferase involved in cell wall biosynthesis
VKPFVSLIVPCRNEEATIGGLLQSLLEQDYPADLVEVVLVDGMSTDRTREVAREFARQHPWLEVKLLSNPQKITPVAFNLGIAAAKGDVVFFLGAHSRYSANYLSGVIAAVHETGADAVGSTAVTVPASETRIARAIALALSSRFGVGNSLMRVGVRQPVEADTASCPGYRREVFDRVGRFNERLVRNQDIEFNLRLRRAGGRIVVDPRITTHYRARGTLRDLFRNNFWNGYWVVRGARVSRLPFALRHLVPLAFVLSLVAGAVSAVLTGSTAALGLPVVAYLAADVWFALRDGRGRTKADTNRADLVLPLLGVFPTLHLGYGLGSLWALVTFWAQTRTGVDGKGQAPTSQEALHGARR